MSENNKDNPANAETPSPYTEATNPTSAKSSAATAPRHIPHSHEPLQGHPSQNYPAPMHAHHQHPYTYMYPPYSFFPHLHSALPGTPLHHSESSTHESPLSTPQAASLPLSSEIDPATGLPLSILNNLRDFLPSTSNTNPKNELYKPLKENDDNETQSHQANDTQELKSLSQSARDSSILSPATSKSDQSRHSSKSNPIASKGVSLKQNEEKTYPSKQPNNLISERDENDVPESSPNFSTPTPQSGNTQSPYLSDAESTSTTNLNSTETFLEHLKSVNASLHHSIASGNFSIHAFESQIKSIDQEFNSYNHTIGELTSKVEKENEKISGQGRENDIIEKGDLSRSPFSQRKVQRSEEKQIESAEDENNLLLEKIDALEKELKNEKRIAKTTYTNMEKKMLKESEELEKDCKETENILEKEYQELLDVNKALSINDD